MGGWGYSFSMWQTLQMWQMLSKCISYILYDIFVHFVRYFPAQKPYLCTEFQSALKFQNKHVNC